MKTRKPRYTDRDPDRVAIAVYLGERGPTAGDKLTRALALMPERFWALVNHPWFKITGKGWDLTETGRREGLEAG
jgi:hypothetical protein